MEKHSRRSYLDMLRIIACFLVIFNHLRGYTAYQHSTNFGQAFYYMGYTMFTRINVPVFFMISGALLLSRDVDYKDLFMKRIARIVITLFCASFVIYLIGIRKDIRSFSVVIFLRKLLLGEHATAYWYLYAYLGFLVTLPFMRRVVKGFQHKDFALLVGVHFVIWTFLPIFNYIIGEFDIAAVKLSSDFSIPLMSIKAFFYPLVGYYIDQVFDISRINRRNVWILPGIIVFGIAASSAITYHEGINYQYSQNYVQTFDYTTAIATFLLVKYLFVNVKAVENCNFLHKAVTLIGSLTLGMYLMDPAMRVLTGKFEAIVTTSDPILYSVIWCVFSMTVSGVITFGLKKLPVVKNLL